MELRDALTQIAEIRQQMARGTIFRGYRAATTAFSGCVAIATGVVQSLLPGVGGGGGGGGGASICSDMGGGGGGVADCGGD